MTDRPLTLLVCGSRTWKDADRIKRVLSRWWRYHDLILLHGDALGADQIAARVGREFGWTVRAFPADWKAHGKAAGPIRNRLMLDEQPDLVLAFQVDGSRGTQDTVDEARRRGIRTWVIESEPEGYA